MYKLVDRETHNGVFGEFEDIADLVKDVASRIPDDEEEENILADEAVDYYEAVDPDGNTISLGWSCNRTRDHEYVEAYDSEDRLIASAEIKR